MRLTPPARLVTALALIATCLGALAGPASAAPAGQVLYSPDLSAFPQGDASYPRAIRLDHDGSANETMLATYARRGHNAPASFPIHRSTDGGRTWSAGPISTVTSHTPGWGIGAPVLYEVPRTANGLNQGDILAAGTAWVDGDYTAQKVEVFRSTDHGVTWTYLSNCTQTSGLPDTIGHGIWEPWFLLAPDNTLACFISDERPANSATNNQVIGHYTSTDGGRSWSATMTLDVAFPADNLARPGMSIVTGLPNGTFLMAYELCRDATDADHACEVYVKTSSNGLNWGTGAGTLVRTADQRELLHTPYVAWLPGGGPNGTLLLSGQRVVAGPTGDKTVLGESGQVIFANTNLGAGEWTEIEAPALTSPTGGYNPGEPSCPGYSSPVVPSANGTDFLYLTATRLTGNQCQVRYGLGTLPAKAVRITGPGGKCLDVDTNTNANGNAAQLWDCGVATGQRWSRHPEGSLRAFGKCLDVDAQGTANHTEVQLWECNGSGAQKWTHRSDGSLFNPQSGRCLDAPQGATANGTKLQIYDCNGLFPQQWTIPA
ncbi:hypothetical protein HD597_010708 [Nonomuraea thailandensis]|uniref:Ricin B lectin domain-containing protein n=1 Tax=Nonomuraea thailandensis TaxID=1188745 RepID=A0A9X2H0H9_9ACTN|nr:sialidase family protein [Nonomuraea thailandensis]MCP2363688.1 hypothetical protein [Nonomuraea thailandensis]